MKYWIVTSSIQQRNGKSVEETTYVQSEDAPHVGAEEIPRLPNYGEKWDGKRFVLDEALKTKHEENARLSGMSRGDLVAEIMAKVDQRIPHANPGNA